VRCAAAAALFDCRVRRIKLSSQVCFLRSNRKLRLQLRHARHPFVASVEDVRRVTIAREAFFARHAYAATVEYLCGMEFRCRLLLRLWHDRDSPSSGSENQVSWPSDRKASSNILSLSPKIPGRRHRRAHEQNSRMRSATPDVQQF